MIRDENDIIQQVRPQKVCDFCYTPIKIGYTYCSDYCDRQDNSWWLSIHRTASPGDPHKGREWLTIGGL